MSRLALAAASIAALAFAGAAAAAPTVLPVDQATTVNGVEVACTGVGDTRLDPRWSAYGVRVEFSNARNEYLVGAEVVIRDHAGATLMDVSCDAPWVLLRLPKGDYAVEGRLLESQAKPRSARFTPPTSGQIRVVLQFPDA